MRKICILADSLGSERPDGIDLKSRWPELLKADSQQYEIKNYSKSFSTTKRILEIENIDAEIFIFQLGIVDCAPRLFGKNENRVLSRLPKFLLKIVVLIAKKYRVVSSSRAYVNAKDFENNILNFVKCKPKSKIVFLKILPPGKSLVKLNPGIVQSINIYNEIIDRIQRENSNFDTVSIPKNIIEDITLGDGYHLNVNGHQLIFSEVKKKLNEYENSDNKRVG